MFVFLTTYIPIYICICIYIGQNLNKDLLRFYRNVKLKALFGASKQNKDQLKLKSNSNWTPGKLFSCVDTFITAVDDDINNTLLKPIPKDNLAKSERKALENLQQRDDIIITKADKGGAVVIMDVEHYINEANRQLSDTKNYQKLNINTTE